MATLDEVFATMPEEAAIEAVDEVFVIDPNNRVVVVPSAEAVFGVESDAAAERKCFRCPRIVGNDIDLSTAIVRVNYRNANGESDSYIVTDLQVVGDEVVFSWELSRKVTKYMGSIQFIVCAVAGDVKWNTTLATGLVLEGLEPANSGVEEATSDVVAQLVSLVAEQSDKVRTAAQEATATAEAKIEAKGVATIASIPDDYTALSDAVEGLARNTAGAIVCEVSGESIVVDDASNNYLQGLRVFGRSTQDGTPTPDTPVEIVSVEAPSVTVCGKNLLKEAEIPSSMTGSGITCDYEGGGVFHIYGTHTGEAQEVQLAGTGLYLPVDPAASYTLVVKLLEGTHPAKFHFFLGLASDSVPFRNWFSVPLEQDATVGMLLHDTRRPADTLGDVTQISRFWIYSYNADLTAYTVNFRVQVWLEQGETPTAHEPYTEQTVKLAHTLPGIPVTSGGNYTDSDGQQWICDEVDLERGVYVQRVSKQTITDFSASSNYLKFDGFTEGNVWLQTNVLYATGLCDRFVYAANGAKERFAALGSGAVYFVVSGELTQEEWRTRMAELAPTIMLALQNPIETPLSEAEIAAYRALHSNKPTTTILNDGGAYMTAEYVADTKLYIDNKIAALTA